MMKLQENKTNIQEKYPLISIIVPVYNVEKYLDRCITHLLNQTYKNLEIILINDGSTDNSAIMCDEYANKYNNIFVIHKKNAGLGYARNTGIDKSKGKYILFVDSDDFIEDSMIMDLYNCLQENGADTCIGGYKRVYANNSVRVKNAFSGKCFENDEIKNFILPMMFGKEPGNSQFIEMSVWKVLFSRSIIKDNNIYFPSERKLISEDINFDIQYYANARKVCFSENVGYCYCDNEGSLTTKYRRERFHLLKIQYLEMEKQSIKLSIQKQTDQRAKNYLISNVRSCIKQEQRFCNINEAKKHIREICNDDLIIRVLKEFNDLNVPLKNRLVNNMIRRKNTNLLMIVMWIKNKFNI